MSTRGLWLIGILSVWLLLSLVAASVGEPGQPALALLVIQQVLLFGGGWIGARDIIQLGLRAYDTYRGLAAGLGLFLVNILASAVTVAVLTRLLGPETVEQSLEQERQGMDYLLGLARTGQIWLVALLVGVGAPLSEEVFFRGLMLPYLLERMSSAAAIILTALCFAVLHFYTIQFFPVFASGLVLGLLFIASGRRLWCPIVAHGAANLLVLAVSLAAS